MRKVNLQKLSPRPVPEGQRFVWGKITATGPLRLQLDSDTAVLGGVNPVTPITVVTGLAVNDRVLVLLMDNPNPNFSGRQVVIIGKAS